MAAICLSGFNCAGEASEDPVGVSREEIVSGYDTHIADHPWMVSLLLPGHHWCGGSILNEQWVLTAAHCVQLDLGLYQVAAGITYMSQVGVEGQLRDAAEIVVHLGYDHDAATHADDIALVRVSPPFDLSSGLVRSIPVASEQDELELLTHPGVYASNTGWGDLTHAEGDPPSVPYPRPNRLQEVDLPIVSIDHALSLYGGAVEEEAVTESLIAAGGVGGRDSCDADSGGPLTVANINGTGALLVGIVNGGAGGCDAQFPAIHARVSWYHDWIRSVIGCPVVEPGHWSYCTEDCPCGAGKGDCDGDATCGEGLSCISDVGAHYGYLPGVDVCEATCTRGTHGGWSFCSRDCPCDLGEGDCDHDGECLPGLTCKLDVGALHGFSANVDVCERPCASGPVGGFYYCTEDCPCGLGEGDCNSDDDCAPDLRCYHDVGSVFGFLPSVDVCLNPGVGFPSWP